MTRRDNRSASARGVRPLAAIGLFLALSSPVFAAEVTLDRDSNITIMTAGVAEQELELASSLLQRYLLLALERKELSGAGPKVSFRLEALAISWETLPKSAMTSLRDMDAFEIEVKAAPAQEIHIRGATVLATCFGVIEFLDASLGVTWLFPGDLGLALPEQRSFTIAEGKTRRAPSVVSRIFSGMQYQQPELMAPFRQKYAKSPLLAGRNFFSGWDYFKSLRLNAPLVVHHNMINIFPVAECKREHPEVFPVKDGKPFLPPEDKAAKGHANWHPCYSSAKALEIAVARARKAFETGALVFSLGINDGLRAQCECEECRKAGWPESYYRFVSRVADAVKDQYPPRMIGVLVYGDVRHPRQPLRLPENVYCNITTGSKISEWSSRASHLGSYAYFYGSGFSLPSFPLKSMTWNAAQFERHGILGYYAETYPVWAFDAPKVYVQSRLFWNPKMDVEAALSRFCAAAYGPGGPAMTRFFRLWAGQADGLVKTNTNDPAPLCDMSKWRNSSSQFSAVATETMQAASALIEEAQRAAKADPHVKRLDMVKAHFDLARALHGLNSVVQDTFDAQPRKDLAGVFAALRQGMDQRASAEKRIGEHPEWALGASPAQAGPGWTLDTEVHTAAITAIIKLREAGALTGATRDALPGDLRPYLAPLKSAPKPARVQNIEKGVYYSAPGSLSRYTPMQVTVGDTTECRTKGENPVIDAGAQEGQFKQHWAALYFGSQPGRTRQVFRVEIAAKGKSGSLNVNIGNNWRFTKGDGLPVQTDMEFGEAGGQASRLFYVEPLLPESPLAEKPRSHKVFLVWTPDSASAACEASVTLTPGTIE